MRISYDDMLKKFKDILVKKGFPEEEAYQSAKIFTDNSLDGVYSHGVNRFSKVINYIDKGHITVGVKPEKVEGFGGYERWDGRQGMGNLNARFSMDRAIKLAKDFGIGLVALRNTNHWMRGGTYGWQAADSGCVGICWTNTLPNMPPWGGQDIRIGNNPFIIAIPRSDGRHLVVDMAMSQFSYGKIEQYKLKGSQLPIPGGFDKDGNLTTDPEAIEETSRVLPTGYWKGSSLSIALDLVAAVLSGGNSTYDIGRLGEGEDEFSISQVFIAIDQARFNLPEISDEMVTNTIEFIKSSKPVDSETTILYPGERVLKTRQENLDQGIPVNETIWKEILSL